MAKRFWDSAESELDRYQLLSDLLNRNTRWIDVVDTKVIAVLFFVGAIIRANGSARDLDWTEVSRLNSGVAAAGALFVITSVAVAGAALGTVYPLLPRVVRQRGRGRMFLADIEERGSGEWEQSILGAWPSDLVTVLIRQVHASRTIAARKHRHVRKDIIGGCRASSGPCALCARCRGRLNLDSSRGRWQGATEWR